MSESGTVIGTSGRLGDLAIIDFYHNEGGAFYITAATGWTLTRIQKLSAFTVLRFAKIVTEQNGGGYWAFSWPANVEYMIDYVPASAPAPWEEE